MKSKKKDYLFFGTVILLVVAIIGVSYAYFKLQIEGSGKDIVMETADLRLRYTDGDTITLNNAFPGDNVSKTVTVENIGTKDVSYSLYWSDLINTIERYELHVTLDCKSYTGYGTDSKVESGTCDSIYRAVPISNTSTSALIKNNLPIAVGVTHEYTITVTFDDKEYEQNYNKKKNFTGKIDVREYSSPAPVYCTYDGELTQGATFTRGSYTYKYKQEQIEDENYDIVWTNINDDGWGVSLTDSTSTNAISDSPCTHINEKPVVSTSYLFAYSESTSLDLSDWDTSNIINMNNMFDNSAATEIKGLENFNTGKVTDMSYMFKVSKADTLILTNFDTSNVTNMVGMFAGTVTNALDLSNFNTGNVTNMRAMFGDNNATFLDLSSFDTSNVTNMGQMFRGSSISNIIGYEKFNTGNVINFDFMFAETQLLLIDVSKYDTSNASNMTGMFAKNIAKEIRGLANFNTSKVAAMGAMFMSSKYLTSLDLSSFDTSNLVTAQQMFQNCKELKTIYVSNKFVVDKVTVSDHMFWLSDNLVGGNGTGYDSSKIDKTYARIDTADAPGYFTLK